MIHVQAHLSVYGETFSPRLLKASITERLSQRNEPGDIGALGRYRGKPLPYGSAEVDLFESTSHVLAGDLSLLESIAASCREAGANDMVVWFGVTGPLPLHLEFGVKLMKELGGAALPIAMSCYPTSPTLSEEQLKGARLSDGPVPGVSTSLVTSGSRQAVELFQGAWTRAVPLPLLSRGVLRDANSGNAVETATFGLTPQWPLAVDLQTISAVSSLAHEVGASLVEVHAHVEFETQCNLELSSAFLGHLSSVDLPFSLWCEQVKAAKPNT